MARTREVGTLWIGGPLTWLEQVCLKSFVDRGQKITLFSYEDIPNVPDGVIRRDGREIIDTDDFIKYERKNSYALFADLFRLHMIKKCPSMIWVDTDVYCHRPADYDDDHVFGYENPEIFRVNNAVLGAPHDSPMLDEMLAFTSDRFSIAPFLPATTRAAMKQAADAGQPVHITKQAWGVWGPMMMTYYARKHNLLDKVQPLDAFYPILFRERGRFMKASERSKRYLTENTTLLHLWASNKRQLGNFHFGLPPLGSYYDEIVKEHGIVAPLAPVRGRARTSFDGALVDEIDLKKVNVAADLSGNAQPILLALYHRFGCDLQLFNVTQRGYFANQDVVWLEKYLAFLIDRGVPENKIQVVRSKDDIRPVDILCNLHGFGATRKLFPLRNYVTACVHENSRVFTDLIATERRLDYLSGMGSYDTLSEDKTDGGEPLFRIRLKPEPGLWANTPD